MTIAEIKEAVENGKKVIWIHSSYKVIKDNIGQFLIKHDSGDCIGLTNKAGDKLNGDESEFFVID